MSPACSKHSISSADTFMQIWGSLARAYGRTRTVAWAFPSTAARHCMPDTPIVARLATRVAFACCSVVSDNYGLPYAANLHFYDVFM